MVHGNVTGTDVAGRILSRPKRYLIFPQGSNFQVNLYSNNDQEGKRPFTRSRLISRGAREFRIVIRIICRDL